MMPLEIPIVVDNPLFEIRTTLDGREFVLRFDWNDRISRWFMSLYSIDGIVLSGGIRLLSNRPLFRKRIDARLPPGILMCIDINESGIPAGYADLGQRVRLIYFEVGNA